ncbi:MAG: Gfo/Idh/MocA family oxidoreductase [Candidatus Latescibacterota bacterium]
MKTVKWGIIGCGDIARKRVIPALKDLRTCELIALCRARAELAETCAAEFGVPGWYASWTDMLRDSEIEAVYIATPVHLHCEQTVEAAEAGKHVLCEKPMALNTAECDRMIAACGANGVKLGIAYYRHFYPVVERIREILNSGEIGKSVLCQMNAFEYYNPDPSDRRYWFLRKDLSGGGPMFDFGCHRIEVLLNLFGKESFSAGFISKVAFEREVEDTATAYLGFPSGPRAVLTVTHASFESRDTLDIFGTDGALHVPSLNKEILVVKTRAGERMEQHPAHPNFHLPLIADFTKAVLENREPRVDGNAGREVNRVLENIYNGWNFIK